MYAFFLRAVTLSVLYFCLIYWTDVMEVVTLGGLIAGACIAGIGSALVQMRLLPGYTVTDKFGALVLLAVFCLMVLGVTELTVKKEIK